MNFDDKVVLVTGASSGIGAAIAIAFAKNGANLALVGRNVNNLNIVQEKIKKLGKKVFCIAADVTKDEDAEKIFSSTITHFGKLDVLVNNAGSAGFESILSENAMETFDKIMALNLRSAVKNTNLAAEHLIQTKGTIINISSVGSLGVLHPHNFAYCTSKAALDHFTRATAVELSCYGVRINTVNPGPVKTNFGKTMNLSEEEEQKMFDTLGKATLLGKLIDPEEVAGVVMFLASDMAKSVTGSSYLIDNGLLLKGSLGI